MVYWIVIGLLAIIITYIILHVRTERKLNFDLKTGEFYESLFKNNPDTIITFDLEGKMLSANDVVGNYGYTVEELLNKSFLPFIVEEKLEITLESFKKATEGIPTTYDTAVYNKKGQPIEMNITNLPIIVNNKVEGVFSILKDVTSYKETQNALVEAESQYRNLTEDSIVSIYMIQDSKYVFVNQKLVELSGYEKEELIGMDAIELIHPDDRSYVLKKMKKRLYKDGANFRDEYRAMKKDRSTVYIEVHGARALYKGKPAIIGTVIDITERKKNEETIKFMAYHDSLTGLYNRNYIYDQLKAEIEQNGDEPLAVFFFDLDRFKHVNDSLGHSTGDILLKAVALRLKNRLFQDRNLARNGGDEFTVFQKVKDRKEAEEVAKRILQCFETPFSLEHYELYVTPSIGISLYPEDGKDVDTLIKKADSAMYQAKQNGKNMFHFYCSNNEDTTFEKLKYETSLRKAIEAKEFILYYQPKLDLTTGKISGVEALVRWNHPTKGFIPPLDFIPLAEETGLIIPLGEWILREACEQNVKWQKQGLPPFVMSVNLSVRQLYQPNLIETIRQVLEETGLSPECLEVEITESMLLDKVHGIKVLKELESLGIQISLDDFGTGYSSLHYLKEVPIHKLKVDQSFVRNSTSDSNDRAIVKTIIGMAHQLKLTVIAEGVETREHLIFLQRNLCDVAQGYLFSRPIPPDEFVQQFENLEKMVQQNGVPQDSYHNERMEETLHLARQELVDMISQQQGMIFKFEKKGNTFIHTLCNGELLYSIGLIPEDVVGKELKEFYPLHEVEQKTTYYERAWKGEKVTYEGRVGDLVYLASLRPVKKGGRIVEVIASCIDISERKKIEKALKESETKYRLITENMLDLIGIVDQNGVLTYASPSHETILGHSPSYFEGKNILELCHPDDVQLVDEHFQTMIKDKTSSKINFRLKHVNGEWLHLEMTVNPVKDTNGEVKHYIVVGRDITELKRLESLIEKYDD
ncbi:PAS domain S-box protein [Bacillus suaedaesalsae]|uniref:PAS domain S-box protein n=1 Tax=Bacillus suaedaesalsae TaxID=2810349 RepID=A0ABS2DE32_9BACI|nr:PAS domain S-box protein [Bacillus suaedaesalsae]